MDFKSLMASAIAQSKPKVAPNSNGNSKYIKRSELEAAREAAYVAEQEAKEKERQETAEKKRRLDEEEIERKHEREAKRIRLAEESRRRREAEERETERERRKRLGLPELLEITANGEEEATSTKDDLQDIEAEDMTDEDLTIKFRMLAEPIRLFGENHRLRLKRYRRLATDEASRSRGSSRELEAKQKPKVPISTELEPVPGGDMIIAESVPAAKDGEARQFLARQLTSWFNLILTEWAVALAGREDAVKKTLAGQQASNSYTQAIAHLRPLFRKLEAYGSPTNDSKAAAAEMPKDLLNPLLEIVRAAQARRYVEANDAYLRLSIGKAAWPIGVTMVGIHERSAREKLHESDKQAHIMSDEATRKILQSIKRCLSFAQTRWPPEDVGQLMG